MEWLTILRYCSFLAELLAFIGSIVYWQRYNGVNGLKGMPIFLGTLVLFESLGILSFYNFTLADPVLLANIIVPIQFIFYFSIFVLNRLTKGHWIFAIGSLLVYLISLLVEGSKALLSGNKFLAISFMIGCCLLLFTALFYIIGSIRNYDGSALKNKPLVVMGFALFVAFSFELCIFSLRNYVQISSDVEMELFTDLYSVKVISSTFMYLLFFLAFRWTINSELN